MSSKPKNASRTNIPGHSPETPPAHSLSANVPARSAANPSNPPRRPQMAANGREIEISEFTFRQQSALPIVAVSRTLELLRLAVGVGFKPAPARSPCAASRHPSPVHPVHPSQYTHVRKWPEMAAKTEISARHAAGAASLA